jgi:broad specificity phosphatase PhoE
MIELLFQRIIMNKSILIVGALAFLLFLGCSQETTAPSKNEPNSTNNEMANFSCKTESLLDSSGIKIICGGDSIGVVFNGSNGTKGTDGEDGKDGKDGVDGTNGVDGKDGTSCTIIPLESIDAHKLMCGGDSVGILYNGTNGVDGKDGTNGIDGKDGVDGTGCTSTAVIEDITGISGVRIQCGNEEPTFVWDGADGADGINGTNGVDGKDGADGINGTNGIDGKDGVDGTGCSSTAVTDELTGKSGVRVQCGEDEPVYVWNGMDGEDGADGVSCYVQENADLSGFDVYCGGLKVGTLQNGQDGTNGVDGKDGVDGTGCTSTAVTDSVTGKSGVQIQCGEDEPTYIWDGTNSVANKVEELSEQCLAIRATKNDFIPLTDIFPCVRSNEKLAFIIRHAARDRDASGNLAPLNSEGRVQAVDLGERLSATGDFFYMHTHYYRNMETVMLMAQGKGQTIPDSASLYSVIEDEYHLQTQDLLESWFVKDETKVDACKSPQSWGWSAYSKFAYEEENLTACQAAFYDVDDRVQDFIAKYFTYEQMHDMTMAISHDQFVVPFLVSISDRQLDLRFHNHENDFNYWINYLTGVAIIVDPDNQVTIIPVKSLDDAYLRVF